MWHGENEKNIKGLFNTARKKASAGKKVILFFDEADGLFEKRTNLKSHKEGLISILLQEMDGISENSLKNIFIFFTTNRLEIIDGPVLERFDKKIKINLPNKQNRIKLIKLFIDEKIKNSSNKLFGDIDYDELADRLKGKSGRFIKQLINNSVLAFAQLKLDNQDVELISTQDIIGKIKITEAEIKSSKPIGILTN